MGDEISNVAHGVVVLVVKVWSGGNGASVEGAGVVFGSVRETGGYDKKLCAWFSFAERVGL